jgi:glycerophosphoryl diester phosphodiesterase
MLPVLLLALAAPMYPKPTNIAHRGASAYAPEHTLAAYELAIKQGADFVEPDLQVTKDGVLVCLHDTTLARTTDAKAKFPGRSPWRVADFTLAEVQTLDAGAWFDPKFAGQRVPTFQQMLDVVRGKAGVIPETKAPEVYGKLGLDMEPKLMKVLADNGLDKPDADPKTPVVVQSFSADSLKLLRQKHGCKLPLVYLVGFGPAAERATSPEGLAEVKGFADGVGPNRAVVLARPGLVADAHKLGLSVTVYTVGGRDPARFPAIRAEMAKFVRELKVDAVFTDNPDLFPRD